jgi:hypothetical protein
MRPEDKPSAFALYHGCEKLGVPVSKYSTLKKYFYDGRRLSNQHNDVVKAKTAV